MHSHWAEREQGIFLTASVWLFKWHNQPWISSIWTPCLLVFFYQIIAQGCCFPVEGKMVKTLKWLWKVKEEIARRLSKRQSDRREWSVMSTSQRMQGRDEEIWLASSGEKEINRNGKPFEIMNWGKPKFNLEQGLLFSEPHTYYF